MNNFYIIYAEKENDWIEELMRCTDRKIAEQIAESHLNDPGTIKTYVCMHYTVTEFIK